MFIFLLIKKGPEREMMNLKLSRIMRSFTLLKKEGESMKIDTLMIVKWDILANIRRRFHKGLDECKAHRRLYLVASLSNFRFDFCTLAHIFLFLMLCLVFLYILNFCYKEITISPGRKRKLDVDLSSHIGKQKKKEKLRSVV